MILLCFSNRRLHAAVALWQIASRVCLAAIWCRGRTGTKFLSALTGRVLTLHGLLRPILQGSVAEEMSADAAKRKKYVSAEYGLPINIKTADSLPHADSAGSLSLNDVRVAFHDGSAPFAPNVMRSNQLDPEFRLWHPATSRLAAEDSVYGSTLSGPDKDLVQCPFLCWTSSLSLVGKHTQVLTGRRLSSVLPGNFTEKLLHNFAHQTSRDFEPMGMPSVQEVVPPPEPPKEEEYVFDPSMC